jgi:hypothetical protein
METLGNVSGETLSEAGTPPAIDQSSEILPGAVIAAEPGSATDFEPVQIGWRESGWTPERQRQFIEELADCGMVREAAARVGMAEQSAYRLRRRPDAAGFNRAWDAAVQLGVDRLHSIAFERALTGTVKRRYWEGQVVGEERVYDNRLLLALLARLDGKRTPEIDRTIADWQGSMRALDDGLGNPIYFDPEFQAIKREAGIEEEDDDEPMPPVWYLESEGWRTTFVPPEGFAGFEAGRFGEESYFRELTPEELAKVEAWQARLRAQAALQRDRYFDRLEEKC